MPLLLMLSKQTSRHCCVIPWLALAVDDAKLLMAHTSDKNGIARLGNGQRLGNGLAPVGNLASVTCPASLVNAAQNCLADASWLFVITLLVGNDDLVGQRAAISPMMGRFACHDRPSRQTPR